MDVVFLTLLQLKAGSTGSYCSGLCPFQFLISPRTESSNCVSLQTLGLILHGLLPFVILIACEEVAMKCFGAEKHFVHALCRGIKTCT